MSNNIWNSSDQERAAQEERERRRREIMDRIHALEQKKGSYQGLKGQLYGQKMKLEEILSQITILASMELEADRNFFTCVTEDTTAAGVVCARTAMREKNKSISSLASAAEAQIGQLESCIYRLEENIRELEAQL